MAQISLPSVLMVIQKSGLSPCASMEKSSMICCMVICWWTWRLPLLWVCLKIDLVQLGHQLLGGTCRANWKQAMKEIKLFDYQEDMKGWIGKALRLHWSVMVQMPTGTGKRGSVSEYGYQHSPINGLCHRIVPKVQYSISLWIYWYRWLLFPLGKNEIM